MRWFLLSLILLIVVTGGTVLALAPSASSEAPGTPSRILTPAPVTSTPVDGTLTPVAPTPSPGVGTPTPASPTPPTTATATPLPPDATASPSPAPSTPTPTATPGPHGDLLPDMVTFQPSELRITVEEGRRLLRFTNDIGNMSNGVLELFPGPVDSSMCGDPLNPGRLVYQRIYRDNGAVGYFVRGTTTEYSEKVAGCMVFHPLHDHWHFDGFTMFELRGPQGQVVRGNKTSTCMMDSQRAFNLPGVPARQHYLYGDCNVDSAQGVSIGWLDRYEWDLPDQFVDITGVPDGAYCLVSNADPDNLIAEVDEGNNSASIYVEITGEIVTPFPDRPCPGESEPNHGPPRDPVAAQVFYDTMYWQEWAWDTALDLHATGQVYEGQWSISVKFNAAWASFSMDSGGFDTSGYSHLQFYLYPEGPRLPTSEVSVTDTTGKLLGAIHIWDYARDVGNGWHVVRVPLTDLAAVDMLIGEIRFEDLAGMPQPLFYLDAVEFIRGGG